MNEHVIQTHGLTRYFGSKCAVDQVNLSIPRGSVFALMGRNGSGKSTLVRMLMGLLDPTRGSATVLGEDCRHLTPANRGRIGFVPEGHPLIDWMRVRELESFQKSFFPNWNDRIFKTVIAHFELDCNSRAGQLSRGQRAGVSLALALASEPELLVMDDPAMGLDPVARRTLLEAMILLTRNAGHTIFFSSHLLADVERVADFVAIIDRSVLRVSAPIETFRARVKRMILNFAGNPPPLPLIPGLLQARRENNEMQLILANFDEQTMRVIQSLGAISVNEAPISFEEIIVAYLGERGEKPTLLQATRETEMAR